MQRAQSIRFNSAFTRRLAVGGTGGRSSAGGPRLKPVILKNPLAGKQGPGYRYHRGGRATANASGKLKDHMRYLDRGDDRNLYNDQGRKISASDSMKQHENAFVEHRMVLSPGGKGYMDEELHTLAQSHLQEMRSINQKCELEIQYALHRDGPNDHIHFISTSQNHARFKKQDWQQMRAGAEEFKQELLNENGLEHVDDKFRSADRQLEADQQQHQQQQIEALEGGLR